MTICGSLLKTSLWQGTRDEPLLGSGRQKPILQIPYSGRQLVSLLSQIVLAIPFVTIGCAIGRSHIYDVRAQFCNFVAQGLNIRTTGLPRRAWVAPWRYAILGGIFAGYFVLMFYGLKTAAPVATAAVFTLTPVMSAAFGWIFLRQTMTGRMALALAIGAAVAAPHAKVLSLNGDGAAMYTVQGLWTIAREELDVTTVVFANHAYRILGIELGRTGAGNAGPAASRLLDLSAPKIDWLQIAGGLGIPAVRASTAEAFDEAFEAAMTQRGPRFIEAAL